MFTFGLGKLGSSCVYNSIVILIGSAIFKLYFGSSCDVFLIAIAKVCVTVILIGLILLAIVRILENKYIEEMQDELNKYFSVSVKRVNLDELKDKDKEDDSCEDEK